MIIVPDCLCGRGPLCGLVTGKPDAQDWDKIWLPAGYLNRVKGSDFLAGKKESNEHDFPNRREAAKAYLSDAKKGFNRYNRITD